MSLKARYQTLSRVTFTEADEFTPSVEVKTTFKGFIQPPRNGNSFINGKDTSTIDALLFTDIKTVLSEGDLIEDTNGIRYILSGAGSQPLGVTGIKPKRGQHSEYSLVFNNRGS